MVVMMWILNGKRKRESKMRFGWGLLRKKLIWKLLRMVLCVFEYKGDLEGEKVIILYSNVIFYNNRKVKKVKCF